MKTRGYYDPIWERIGVLRSEGFATAELSSATGVKGASVLRDVPHFAFAEGFPQDYMHDVLEGVLRKVRASAYIYLSICFSSAYAVF